MPRFWSIIILAALLAGCGAPAPATLPPPLSQVRLTPLPATFTPGVPATRAPAIYPGEQWQTAPPDELDIDPGQLQALLQAIPGQAPNLSSVMVVQHGQVALEAYFNGAGPATRKEIYSVTKSFIATLIGIAIDQGLIANVDTRVLSFFPARTVQNPSPEKDALTLKHVLSMSTGFKWSEADISTLYSSPDWTQYMLDLPIVETPGTRFNYCTGCSHLLSAILTQATGMDALTFAEIYLFDPLEIRGAQWKTSREGLPIGGWGLELTTSDLARLGYLYLRRGVWDARLLLSNFWVQAASFPTIQANPDMNYGYQWWIRPSIHGYAALGREGQMIAVIAERDMVVVFTASGVEHDVEFNLIEKYLLPAGP